MRTISFTLLAGFTLLSSAVFAQKEYSVKGTIKGWPTKYIILERKGNYPGIDSVENKNGSFEFKGTLEGPTNAFLVARTGNPPTFKFLFLEPGNIEINGDFDDIKNAKVSGSPLTTQYFKHQEDKANLQRQSDSLYSLLDAEQDEEKKKSLSQQITDLEKKELSFSTDFIKNNPNSPTSIYELAGLGMSLEYPQLKALYDQLSPEIKSSKQAEDVTTYIQNLGKIQIGNMAPDFIQNDTTGNPIQLSSYKGKYVLLDFWASWCIPCRRENPNMAAAYKTYKDKGFEILGVSIDTKEEEWRWKRAIKNDGITWTQVSDLKGGNNDAAVQYAVQIIPTNFLIDPDGKIIGKNLVGESLQNKLKEIFENK